MVGSIQELAAKLYGMGDWPHVESMTIECGGDTTVIDRPLGKEELPCPEQAFTLTIRVESGHATLGDPADRPSAPRW